MPLLNYVTMLALCLLPTRPRRERSPSAREAERGHALRSALLRIALGLAVAVAMVGVSVMAFGVYGTTLFVGAPFVMGATAAYVFNFEALRPAGTTMGLDLSEASPA